MRLDVSEPSRVLACTVIRSSLFEHIREPPYDDPRLLVLRDTMRHGDAKQITVGDDGVLRIQGRVCAPNVDELYKLILEEAHSSRYQSSIQMAPYEALYGRRCRLPVGWIEPGEARLVGIDLVQDALDKVKIIHEILRTAQSRQKSYADRKILQKVGEVAYELVLPPGLSVMHPVFHVSMLRKYNDDPSNVLDFSTVQLDKDLTYEEDPVAILDR
ncbi:uncharacterized protein [Nicotiana sylvestris]|uniref:uncharacterized protein n=1 Tax=Nicotiana sylvestris TaxID=4096 RepID=UPI00388C85EA